METESIVSSLLDQLLSSVSLQSIPEARVDTRSNVPLSCFDFDEDAATSPAKLDLKRRYQINKSPQLAAMNKGDGKRVKLYSSQRIGYVFSQELIKEVSRLPKVKGRAHQVHELIASYKLLNYLKILPARKASEDELRSFHSEEYIEYLKSCDGGNYICADECKVNNSTIIASQTRSRSPIGDGAGDNAIENKLLQEKDNGDVKKQGSQNERQQEWDMSILDTSQRGEEDFGLGYDCPLLPNMVNLIKLIAGSTLTAVESIIEGKVDIALNWTGGWHHALKDTACGFCYVNDIVIGILKLLSSGYTKVLYVDFDLHHGDGVESAFRHSNKVFTLSFHKYEVGFFPGTGPIDEIGPDRSKGKGYTMNVPLRGGIGDDNYISLTSQVLTKVIDKIRPQVIVAQFGADGLVSDPMNSFNLTPKSLIKSFQLLKATSIPLIALGGGGYNVPNTARCWTLLTSNAVGIDVENDIPDSDPFFLTYGPSYELNIDPGFRKDENSSLELHGLLEKVSENLNLIA